MKFLIQQFGEKRDIKTAHDMCIYIYMYIYRHGKIVSLPYNPKNVHNVSLHDSG